MTSYSTCGRYALIASPLLVVMAFLVAQWQWAILPPLLSNRLQLRVAEYDGFAFRGIHGEFFLVEYSRSIHSNEVTNDNPELYVTAATIPPTRIAELPEDVMARFAAANGIPRTVDDVGVIYELFPEEISVGYRQGKLRWAIVSRNKVGLKIGPTADGPFVELPLKTGKMQRVFGRPKRWGWTPGYGF